MEFRWFCKQKSEEWPMDPMLYEGEKIKIIFFFFRLYFRWRLDSKWAANR